MNPWCRHGMLLGVDCTPCHEEEMAWDPITLEEAIEIHQNIKDAEEKCIEKELLPASRRDIWKKSPIELGVDLWIDHYKMFYKMNPSGDIGGEG